MEYEFHYTYGFSPVPVIDRAVLQNDSAAMRRGLRDLLLMPSRHSVEVVRDGQVIFARSRTRH